ncbi:MAG: TniQ family protein [Geminicoccales bacterium]|uniref:TniQ family protein n=1 Tax=Pelagimonas sp. TaxID=2073170 RepID=UPI003D6A77FD
MSRPSSGIAVMPTRRYVNEAGRGWPVHVFPAPGELLSSWLHRLALANGVPPQYFGRVLRLTGTAWSGQLDRNLPGHVLDLLVEQAGIPAGVIAGLALGPDPLARLRLRLMIKPPKSIASGLQPTRMQYCPACLTEDHAPYFRRSWTLATRVSCFRHGRRLRDRCPSCGSGIVPSRQDRLLPQHVCVRCDGDLRKRTVRAEHDVQKFEGLLDDLLRLHVAGHRMPGQTTLPALLGATCFTVGTEPKSIAQLSLRDRQRLFRQLAEGSMPLHMRPDSLATPIWSRIARVAPTHMGLTKSLTTKIMARTVAGRDTRPARAELIDLMQTIGRLHSDRRAS